MKHIVLFLLLVICFIPSRAQHKVINQMEDSAFVLIADNDRRNRVYVTGRTLKIHYRHNDVIEKVKGKLIVNTSDKIQLVPFRKRSPIISIPLGSVVSITPWHRRGKIWIAWIAGSGLASLGLASLTDNPITTNSKDVPILGLMLLSITGAAMYYVTIALPATFLGEWLFVRSEKKGYHFSVKKVPFKRDAWGKVFPRSFPEYRPVYED